MKFKDIEFRGMSEIYGRMPRSAAWICPTAFPCQSYGTTNPTAELRAYEVGVYKDDVIIPKVEDNVVGWLKPEDVERLFFCGIEA